MTRGGRIVAVVLGVVGVALIVIGLRPVAGGGTDGGGADRGSAIAPTALWSPRRTPGPFVEAVGVVRLETELAEIAVGSAACYRVEVDRLGVIVDDAGPAVIPASTQKLMVAAVALDVLGTDFTFVTEAVALGSPGGPSLDRLWLVGGGDPVLSTPAWIDTLSSRTFYQGLTGSLTPLTKLADDIVAAGVVEIPGGIVGDGSRYSTPRYVASWPESYRTEIGPLGALVVDDGFDPATARPVADPALATAQALTELLTARGVTMGPSSTGDAPTDGVAVATLASAPLDALVTTMLSASDNGTAEALALALDVAGGGSGTTEGGVEVIAARLDALGVDLAGVVLADASGLSRDNRATCGALLGTLALGSRPGLLPVAEGTAIAAARGTLADRFVGTALAGRLYAKTGSLNGVAGLVGLFDPADGTGSPRFAGVFNGGFSNAGGIDRTTAVAQAVAAYPQSPPAAELVPSP